MLHLPMFRTILRCLTRAVLSAWLGFAVIFADQGAARAQAPLEITAPGVRPPASRIEPAESLEGNYLAAIIAGAARDTHAAAIFYREALRADPRNVELLERAFVAFLADGAMPDAFRAAERIVTREPDNDLAHLALGIRALKLKQYQLARRHLERGGRSRAVDITATLLSGWSWLGSGNAQRALRTVDKLKSDSAFNIFREYHAALMADLAGDREEAETRFKSAYSSDRTTLRIVDAYGRFEAARGRRDAAVALYEAFDRLLPRQPIVTDALTRLRASQPLPRFVGKVEEGAAEVLYSLGSVGSRQEDGVIALVYLRLALHLDPDHTMALVTLGDVLERSKQIERAIAVYQQVPMDSPLRRSIDIQIGIAYELLDRTDEAIAHLRGLLDRDPKDIDVHAAIGNVLRNRKRFAEAGEAYSKAIELVGTPGRGHWNLFYSRGISLERTKKWPQAEADFKKALELIPENLTRDRALVLNYLGYSWVDQKLNLDEAFQMLRKAVELSPRDGYIVDSLGWAYYRLGRYEDAVRELERAVELRPGDPVINDHLGDAYWKVGRKLEATFQWAHARDSKPEPDDLVRILWKIEHGLDDDREPPKIETQGPAPAPARNGG